MVHTSVIITSVSYHMHREGVKHQRTLLWIYKIWWRRYCFCFKFVLFFPTFNIWKHLVSWSVLGNSGDDGPFFFHMRCTLLGTHSWWQEYTVYNGDEVGNCGWLLKCLVSIRVPLLTDIRRYTWSDLQRILVITNLSVQQIIVTSVELEFYRIGNLVHRIPYGFIPWQRTPL